MGYTIYERKVSTYFDGHVEESDDHEVFWDFDTAEEASTRAMEAALRCLSHAIAFPSRGPESEWLDEHVNVWEYAVERLVFEVEDGEGETVEVVDPVGFSPFLQELLVAARSSRNWCGSFHGLLCFESEVGDEGDAAAGVPELVNWKGMWGDDLQALRGPGYAGKGNLDLLLPGGMEETSFKSAAEACEVGQWWGEYDTREIDDQLVLDLLTELLAQ